MYAIFLIPVSNLGMNNYSSKLKLKLKLIILLGLICYSYEICEEQHTCFQYGGCGSINKCMFTNFEDEIHQTNRYANLARLYIYNSNIYEIQPWSFRYYNSLIQLWMPNNNITILESGSFNGLSNLEGLYLTNNNIRTISKGIFNGMHSLYILDLSHNQIQSIGNNSFTGMDRLNILYLNNNQISTATALLNSCKSLTELDLSNNKLEKLQFIKNCTQLQMLHAANNNLNNFSGSELSTQITFLDLSDNNLRYIKRADLSNLSSLNQLDLSRNSLFDEQDMAVDLFQDRNLLKVLNLSCTSINRLSVGVFSQMQSLEVLDLSANNLTYLPDSLFHDLKLLRDLYLGNNRLSYFYYDSPYLSRIDINHNLWICDSLSSVIKKLESKILRGNSYNTTNIYGIACYDEIKDFRKIETSNSSDVNDPQKEYFSHLIKTQTELRDAFRQIKTFLEQSTQNRRDSSVNEKLDATLLDIKDILNETHSDIQSFGNLVWQQRLDEKILLINLTNSLGSFSKLENVLATLKNETDFTERVETKDEDTIKQLIIEMKNIIFSLNNNLLSTRSDASTSSTKQQTEAFKVSPPSVTIKSDTIALYCIVVIQLAMFGFFIYKQHRRHRNSRIHDEIIL